MNRTIVRTIALVVLGAVLSGCATTQPGLKQVACITAGVLIGGAAARYGTDDSDAATAAAAVAGGAIGAYLCQEPEAPPPAPPPKPTPPPPPPPEPEPDPDSDGDGVPDSRDECPGTPAGTPVDVNGCPEIPNLTGVHFEFDRAELTAEARAIMDEVVAILTNNPHVRVEALGHTDSIGSNAYNQRLSEDRANAVKTYLESRGISSSRISASGFGESSPIAPNDTKEGRARNRRVELTARPIR